jgi:anthranilate synthase component 1
MLTPTEREFEELRSRGYNLIPVSREIAADLETPVSAFLKVARGDYAFLLESVRGGEKWGRYTFLGAEPAIVIRARANRMDIIRPGRGVEVRSVANCFEELRTEMKRFRAPELAGLPRFFGGAVGFLAYDIVRCFEKIPETAEDDLGVPDLYVMVTDTMLMFDNVRQTLRIIANVPVDQFDQGIYRGRRRNPGRALAALRSAAHRASVQYLPQPAHD